MKKTFIFLAFSGLLLLNVNAQESQSPGKKVVVYAAWRHAV